jgi:hypothetical protein
MEGGRRAHGGPTQTVVSVSAVHAKPVQVNCCFLINGYCTRQWPKKQLQQQQRGVLTHRCVCCSNVPCLCYCRCNAAAFIVLASAIWPHTSPFACCIRRLWGHGIYLYVHAQHKGMLHVLCAQDWQQAVTHVQALTKAEHNHLQYAPER